MVAIGVPALRPETMATSPPLRLPAWRLPKVELPDFAALAPSLRNLRLWPQPAPRRGMKTADA